MMRSRFRPSFVVTISTLALAGCANEHTMNPPMPTPTDTATTATPPATASALMTAPPDASAVTAPTASAIATAPPDPPLSTYGFSEVVPGGFLCGPGSPMFTKPDHSQCLCYGLGNPPLPPRLTTCPATLKK